MESIMKLWRIAQLVYLTWLQIVRLRYRYELMTISRGNYTFILVGNTSYKKFPTVPGNVCFVALIRNDGRTIDGILYIHSSYLSVFELNFPRDFPFFGLGDLYHVVDMQLWDGVTPKNEAMFRFTNSRHFRKP
jgi:hypothetical protein